MLPFTGQNGRNSAVEVQFEYCPAIFLDGEGGFLSLAIDS